MKSDLIQEAQRWVHENQGFKIKTEGEYYASPRLSSEIVDCSMPMTFDQYSYCSLGCLYCFAYFFKSNNPAIKEISLKPVNIGNMIEAIQGKKANSRGNLFYKHFYSKKFLLHWGGLADPFCYFEKSNRSGFPLLKVLGEENYPTLFSFKGNTIMQDDYLKLFSKYSKQRNFAFQISMVTRDDEVAKYVEVGVPSPTERIKIIKVLSDMGYWTILRLRPYIIGISDETIDQLLEDCYQAGIQGISMEFFAMDARANVGMKTRYDWLAKFIGVDDLMKYFSILSPSTRGGYMRLNRFVKERHVEKVYRFCVKNKLVFGCSDPDYKELCMSGSCCAMPDNYPPNRGLENWTRSQLTYHLKEARRLHHKTGEKQELHFHTVYGKEATYLDEVGFQNDHVFVTSQPEGNRRDLTYRKIIRSHWNKLNSPANPCNYLNDKVHPIGLDENDDYIYEYKPMDYESKWDLDLSKK